MMKNENRHKYYNKNHPIIRVDKDFKKMISKISKEKGLSHYEVIRRLLKARYSKGYKDGYGKALSDYQIGSNNSNDKQFDNLNTSNEMERAIYNKGVEAGREKYSIKLPCQKCGKMIEFLPDRPEFVEMFRKLSASHGSCEG